MVSAFGGCFVFDGGNIYKMNKNTYSFMGNVLPRKKIIPVIAGETFGDPRQTLEMSKFYLSLETGEGLLTGQGENPEIMIRASVDAGKTWGQEHREPLGRLGDFEVDVEWDNMQQFRQMFIEISVSDPVPVHIYRASIDLRVVGY